MKIPIKKYVMDESLPWEERYRQLEAHHTEETTYLIDQINRRDKALDDWEEFYRTSFERNA